MINALAHPTSAMLSTSSSKAFAEVIGNTFDRFDLMANPDLLVDSLDSMSLMVAIILVSVGAICLVRGWVWHKMIVLVLALLGGVGVGHMMSLSMGRSMVIAIAIGLLRGARRPTASLDDRRPRRNRRSLRRSERMGHPGPG